MGDVGEAGEVEDLGDTAPGQAVGEGQGEEVVAGGAAGVDGAGLQEGADLGAGCAA